MKMFGFIRPAPAASKPLTAASLFMVQTVGKPQKPVPRINLPYKRHLSQMDCHLVIHIDKSVYFVIMNGEVNYGIQC